MPLPYVTYIPLIVKLLEHLCKLFIQHQAVITNVADQAWPGHTAEIAVAIGQVQSACTTFQNFLIAVRFAQGS